MFTKNMASNLDDIPQWKKDLLLRLRKQNKRLAAGNRQLFAGSSQTQTTSDAVDRAGQQPSTTCTKFSVASVTLTGYNRVTVRKCKEQSTFAAYDKMVQERIRISKQCSYKVPKDENGDNKSDSDSSEDLHYGPGIVNKLKNRYLSLALRENNSKSRPSILQMRKATSLENLLDNDNSEDNKVVSGTLFLGERLTERNTIQTNVSHRYRRGSRTDMKRAHSVETISRSDHNAFPVDNKPKRESLQEEIFIMGMENNRTDTQINDNKMLESPVANRIYTRINKPKRIMPIMNEKEKPPVDVVKQVKKIFEGRPEQRTKPLHTTGEVAAKVATYKNIIVQTKVNKKPLTKQKPYQAVFADKNRKTSDPPVRLPTTKSDVKTSPKTENLIASSQLSDVFISKPKEKTQSLPSIIIPDVSKTSEFLVVNSQGCKIVSSLSETPDLILHSSPPIISPVYRIECTRAFLNEEIKNCYNPIINETKSRWHMNNDAPDCVRSTNDNREISKNLIRSSNSVIYNFSNVQDNGFRYLSTTTIAEAVKIEPVSSYGSSQSAKEDVNGITSNEIIGALSSKINNKNACKLGVKSELLENEPVVNSVSNVKSNLTLREIENNSINSVKTLERPVDRIVLSENCGNVQTVTKTKKPARLQEQNSIVFKFTDREDIPDYIGNDGVTRTMKIERPKVNFVYMYMVNDCYKIVQYLRYLFNYFNV